jgi:hypothetical protein
MTRRGQDLGFYREVPTILAELRKRKIHIAAASRTSAPELYVPLFLLRLPLSSEFGLNDTKKG